MSRSTAESRVQARSWVQLILSGGLWLENIFPCLSANPNLHTGIILGVVCSLSYIGCQSVRSRGPVSESCRSCLPVTGQRWSTPDQRRWGGWGNSEVSGYYSEMACCTRKQDHNTDGVTPVQHSANQHQAMQYPLCTEATQMKEAG